MQYLGPDFEEQLRLFLSEFGNVLSSSTGFRVRVVVDTNVALSETLRLMKGKGPFLAKLSCSPFLDVLAPVEMLDELTEKIREKFQEPKEQSNALEIARDIIQNVRVVRGFKIDSRVKAEALMGHKDPEDVVFMQIALEYDTHGVISKDKAFMNIGEVKRWELGEVGRVLTEVNRGALTLWIVARGLPLAVLGFIKFGMMIVSLGFAALQQLISAGIELGKSVVGSVIAAAKANPLLTLAAVAGAVLISSFLLSWEPSRAIIDDIIEKGKEGVENLISGTAIVIDSMIEAMQTLVEAAREQIPSLILWFDCLASSTLLLFKRVEELERIRT